MSHTYEINDAFTTLPFISSNTFNLVLTDPPYDLHPRIISTLHEEFMRVAPATIVFSPPENQWIQPADQYLFWIKAISTKNTSRRYSRFVEMIFLYGDLKWRPGRHWSQYTNIFTDLVDTSKGHPHRKPPSLIERLIRNHTDPGDHVLDPFAGSGVVGDICAELDRHCTSIEISEDYRE